MRNILMGFMLIGSVAQATHPAVQATPDEIRNVNQYKMLDVNKQGTTRVQRFVDEVDGQKFVCYFTDSYFTLNRETGPGSIHCLPLR